MQALYFEQLLIVDNSQLKVASLRALSVELQKIHQPNALLEPLEVLSRTIYERFYVELFSEEP